MVGVNGGVSGGVSGGVRRVDELNTPKLYLTATMYPSLSKPGKDGFQVLLGSSNPVVSVFILHELVPDIKTLRTEIQPIILAKHLSDVSGLGLAVVDTIYCDVTTSDVWWDVYHYVPDAKSSIRCAQPRLFLM